LIPNELLSPTLSCLFYYKVVGIEHLANDSHWYIINIAIIEEEASIELLDDLKGALMCL
jgi:hypothetical protein